MYIVFAIIIFGLLIAIHEFGHFIAAKACGVRVNEFAIGMGPKILKRQGEETLYSLRLLPIGGFCEMEGEDNDSEDEGSFNKKPIWKRLIILASGSAANFITGVLIVLIIVFSSATGFTGTTLTGFMDGFPLEGEGGLMAGDTIYSIDGERTYYSADIGTIMSLASGDTVDIVVLRDGEKVLLEDLELQLAEYEYDGETVRKYGLLLNPIEANLAEKLQYSGYTTMNYVRMIRLSVSQLISGNAGVSDLSGPVGIVGLMNEVGESSETTAQGLLSVAGLGAFIAVNLAVMNLLPIPALDGGRIFLMAVTWCGEKITRRKFNPKYEGYIHAAGFVLLMGLMVYVMFNDIVKLIT